MYEDLIKKSDEKKYVEQVINMFEDIFKKKDDNIIQINPEKTKKLKFGIFVKLNLLFIELYCNFALVKKIISYLTLN